MKILTTILPKFDLFGHPIQFNNKYTTSFGAFFTFLFLLILFLLTSSKITSYVIKHPTSLVSQYTKQTNSLYLNDSNFLMAFQLDQTQQLQLQQISQSNVNGTIKEQMTLIPLIPCTYDRFQNIVTYQIYLNMDFQNWLCPQHNYSIQLNGSHYDSVSQYARIKVIDNSNTNIPFIFTNSFLESQSIIQYLENPMYLNTQSYDVVFMETILANQKGISIQKQVPIPTSVGQINFRASAIQNIIQIEVMAIDELLAYFGGIINILLVIGILPRSYNKLNYLVGLCNNLYDLDPNNEEQVLKKRESTFIMRQSDQKKNSIQLQSNKLLNSMSSSFMQSPKKTLFQSKHSIMIDKHQTLVEQKGINNRKEYFLSQLLLLFNKSQPIYFSLRYFISRVIFCNKVLKDENNKLLDRGVRRVEEEMNLENILMKLQEIEKLKEILLIRPQQILFNFVPKPKISLLDRQNTPRRQDLFIRGDAEQKRNDFQRSQSKIVERSQKLGLDPVSNIALEQQQKYEEKAIEKSSAQHLSQTLYRAYQQVNELKHEFTNKQLLRKLGQDLMTIYEVSLMLNFNNNQQFTLQQVIKERSSGDVSSEEQIEGIEIEQINRSIM